MLADPPIDAAVIVANEETPAIDRLDQMQVHAPAPAHQHDVPDLRDLAKPVRRSLEPEPRAALGPRRDCVRSSPTGASLMAVSEHHAARRPYAP
jgi:hypothetical protein